MNVWVPLANACTPTAPVVLPLASCEGRRPMQKLWSKPAVLVTSNWTVSPGTTAMLAAWRAARVGDRQLTGRRRA